MASEEWLWTYIEDRMKKEMVPFGWTHEDVLRFLKEHDIDDPDFYWPEYPSRTVADYIKACNSIEPPQGDEGEAGIAMFRTRLWNEQAAMVYMTAALQNAGWKKRRILRTLRRVQYCMASINPEEAAQITTAHNNIVFPRFPGGHHIPKDGHTVGLLFDLDANASILQGTLGETIRKTYTWSGAAVAGYLLKSLSPSRFPIFRKEQVNKESENLLSCLQEAFCRLDMPEAREEYASFLPASACEKRRKQQRADT